MKIKRSELWIYFTFIIIFFWDILEDVMPNCQFILLLFLFCIYLLKDDKFYFSKGCKYVCCLAFAVFFHGVINIFLGNDTLNLLIIQLGSILICYFIFISLIRNHSVGEIFGIYWKFAVVMSFIGIIEVILGLLNISALQNLPIVFTYTKYWYRVGRIVKIASLCREPSFLGYFLAPAVCLILFKILAPELLDQSFKGTNNKFSSVIILLAYLCTFSGVAYFGLIIMIFMIWWKKGVSLKKLLIPIVLIVIALIMYSFVPDIHERVDDTFAVFFKGADGSSVNLSSYTYYANYNVAKKAFIGSYGMGSGLGSYQMMFDKYNIGSWGASTLNLNREDANSGFFRILTELGILGITLVIFFLIHFIPKSRHRNNCYSVACFTLICMYLFRQGNYTHAGSILFLCLYVKSWNETRRIGMLYERKK